MSICSFRQRRVIYTCISLHCDLFLSIVGRYDRLKFIPHQNEIPARPLQSRAYDTETRGKRGGETCRGRHVTKGWESLYSSNSAVARRALCVQLAWCCCRIFVVVVTRVVVVVIVVNFCGGTVTVLLLTARRGSCSFTGTPCVRCSS